jgi:hypothetical protein
VRWPGLLPAPLAPSGGLPQHPDEHRTQGPVLLAVDQQLPEDTGLGVAPVGADRIGPVKVGGHQDAEQLGAWSGAEGIEALPDKGFQLIGSHREEPAAVVLPKEMTRSGVLHFMTRKVRCVTPAPSITLVLSRSIGPVPRWSNNETPPPSRTCTRSRCISSRSPALMQCCTMLNHGAHPEDQLLWSKGRSVLVVPQICQYAQKLER